MKDTESPRSGVRPAFWSFFLISVIAFSVPLANAGSGQLVVSPTNIDFGNRSVGSSISQTITLTNSGGTRLVIRQAGVSGVGYSLSGLYTPFILAGGQSRTCTLTFSPPASGTDSGTVSILYANPRDGKWRYNSDVSTATVSASGTGVSMGQLTASPTSINFGNVLIGNSQTLPDILTNSGTTSVTISAMNVSGSGFSASGLSLPTTLAAGQSTSLNVTFSSASAGNATGSLTITSDASNGTLTVPLSAIAVTPGQLAANPASQSFGNVATGSSSSLSQTLTNVGGSALTISQISTSGSGFSYSGINPPVTLSSNQSVTFNVSFSPLVGGSASGNLVATSNATNPTLSVPLSGTGIAPGQLGVSPASINFGNVVNGSTKTQAATLTASNGPVTVTSASVSQAEFSLSGISLPVTIPSGNSVPFSVVFAPTSTGAASGNITFSSNASNSPISQSLTGSGIAPPQHSVALNWTASTSNNIVGYNVYRATVSGGPYSEIASQVAATTDTDTNVLSGQTYYYVVTAVNSGGIESAHSNQVTAIIPTP